MTYTTEAGLALAVVLAVYLVGSMFWRLAKEGRATVPVGACHVCRRVDARPGSRTCASPDCVTDDDWLHNA